MKLAIIRQRYNPYGGAERFVSRALQALVPQGISVSIIARDWEGVEAVQTVRCNPFYLGRIWRDWSFARAACAAVATRDFDLVQSHERIACCDIYRAGDGVHAQWLANRGRVLTPLARLGLKISPYHAYTLAAERRLFSSPRLKAVICNSRMVAREIRGHFAVSEEKLHVIHNGVELEVFHPRLREEHRAAVRSGLGIAETEMVYLFVGAGFERKGVPALLEAFARLENRSARLLVVGSDRQAGTMRARAVSLGVGERVHFADGQKDVRPWYGASDCFVLPSLYDPFPNAALEAMACGLPVITSSSCGAAELIQDGREGFVCDALDLEGLRERMQRIDPASARSMGREARARVSELGMEAMGEKLAALYRRLLAQP